MSDGTWATLRAAIRGDRHDFTEGSIDRAIVLLAIPMVLEMVMESLFAIVDVYWVSRLGADAVAAVGITESMLNIVYAVAMGVAMAATATVSRRIGERRREEADTAAGQSLLLAGLVSLPIAVIGIAYAPQLIAAMGGTPSVVATGTSYTRIMLGGNATIVFLFVGGAIFRGAGDAAAAMRVLWISNGLNIVLGPLFVFGLGPFPRLGVTGAAVATTIGRGIGVVLQLLVLNTGRGRVGVAARDLVPRGASLAALGRLASSASLQSLIGMASWIVLVRILARFGSAAVAGYTIGMRIVMFAILPAWGLANAAATMVGQNLGAGKPERAEHAVYRAAVWNTIVLGLVGLAFVVAPSWFVRPFAHDPAVLADGVSALRIVGYGFLFYGCGMVFGQAFNGAGDTWTPTVLNVVCFWIFELPLAWLLATPLGLGPRGVYMAMAAAFSVSAVASGIVFRRGKWKTRTV
jgi:putative MATE family efflux protein